MLRSTIGWTYLALLEVMTTPAYMALPCTRKDTPGLSVESPSARESRHGRGSPNERYHRPSQREPGCRRRHAPDRRSGFEITGCFCPLRGFRFLAPIYATGIITAARRGRRQRAQVVRGVLLWSRTVRSCSTRKSHERWLHAGGPGTTIPIHGGQEIGTPICHRIIR